MPKILINEIDETSAGTPGRYGNYSVLITGYMGTPDSTKGELQRPDENGVYEFSSVGAFLATIGEADIEKKNSAAEIAEYHYGNRMAKELLNLGYTIIYKVINSVSDMNSEAFWEIFKDKASYDFRFISHGMLETCYNHAEHTTLYSRLEEIEDAQSKLADIEKRLNKGQPLTFEEFSALDLTKKEEYNDAYEAENYAFKDNDDRTYTSYAAAKEGLAEDRTEIQERINTHNATYFSITNFNAINGYIAKLASYRADDTAPIPGRGDCTALIELDEDTYCEYDPSKRPEALIIDGIVGMSSSIGDDGAYCAMTVPSVYYKIGKDAVKFPGAFHYLACFMSSLRAGFAEWYAVAGYTRGVSSYPIHHTSVKLGEIAINALEPRNKTANGPSFACNVIANFRGSYYLWGNRTAAPLEDGDLTAKHFLNIRQLCSTIKKQLYVSCRRFTFDPNSDTLWLNFQKSIIPTLDLMKADQGIKGYQIVRVATTKKATLKARIRIIPIEAVEDFEITVSLEDSFGGTSVTAV